MNKKGKGYFWIVLIIIVLGVIAYNYFNGQGLIKPNTFAYKAGRSLNLQPPNSTVIEQEIFASVNQQRASNGLGLLTWDDGLASIARAHSQDMCNRNFFSHTNLDGKGPTERAQAAGISTVMYGWVGIGENIGLTPIGDVVGCGNVASEEDVTNCTMDGWMNSPGHRANILDTHYTLIGIGVYCTTSNCWATQDFK